MAIQSRPSIYSRCALLIGVSMFGLFVLGGCQSLNSRWAMKPERMQASDDDDWAPPKVHTRIPREQPYARNSRQANPVSAPQVAESVKESLKDDDGVAAKPSIIETADQEIDVANAIAALPPSFQEIAKRQIVALQNEKKNEPVHASETKQERLTSSKITARISDEESISEPIATVEKEPVPNDSLKAAVAKPVKSAEVEGNKLAVANETHAIESEVVTASAKLTKPTSSDSSTWNSSLGEAIQKLEEEIKNNRIGDENLRLSQEMTLRFLYLANRKLENAVRPVEGLDDNEQEYLRYQLQALFEASNPDAMPVRSRRWSLVMNSQRKATNKLAAASNLEVRSAAFCSDVQNYGVITKFPKYVFKPDQEVLLYCELENVFAQEVKNGFETQLQGTYEIIDANGRRVTDQLLPMEKEICQNHRRDYFIIYKIFVPPQLESGQYQMRVTIEDMKAKKFGQTSLDFQIQP